MLILNPEDACRYLNESWQIERRPATLAKLRSVGGGPLFQKTGRTITYHIDDLDIWALSLRGPRFASVAEWRTTQTGREL